MAGYIPRWFTCPRAVTRPSTKWARFCPISPKPNSPNPILPKPISSIAKNNRTLTLTLSLTLTLTLTLFLTPNLTLFLTLNLTLIERHGLGEMGRHRAKCRLTTLIEVNVLTTTLHCHIVLIVFIVVSLTRATLRSKTKTSLELSRS